MSGAGAAQQCPVRLAVTVPAQQHGCMSLRPRRAAPPPSPPHLSCRCDLGFWGRCTEEPCVCQVTSVRAPRVQRWGAGDIVHRRCSGPPPRRAAPALPPPPHLSCRRDLSFLGRCTEEPCVCQVTSVRAPRVQHWGAGDVIHHWCGGPPPPCRRAPPTPSPPVLPT